MNDINITCAIIAIFDGNDSTFHLKNWISYHQTLGFNHVYIINPFKSSFSADYFEKSHGVTFIIPEETNKLNSSIIVKYYNDLLEKIYDSYDYCAISSTDELFNFGQYSTVQKFIKEFLLKEKLTVAEISWEVYDDNDLIVPFKDKPLSIEELYPRVQKKVPFVWTSNSCSWGRSLFKLGKGIKMSNPHWPVPSSMNDFGGFHTSHVKNSIAVVKKYKTQCLEDYIKSITLPERDLQGEEKNILRSYFDINSISAEKLLYAMRFLKKANWTLTDKDKYWLLGQLEKHPLITVVVRTHNRLDDLKKCLKSLETQYYSCNILILDDCSTDETSAWLGKQKYSHLSLKINVGPGEILARGKYLITTPYYIILDDDDIWNNNMVIERFYEILIENPHTDFINTGYLFHTGHLVSTELLLRCPNLSLWSRDDWYFDWIKKNSEHQVSVNGFDFYGYSRINEGFKEEEDDEYDSSQNSTYYLDGTIKVSGKFYSGDDSSKIRQCIKDNYVKENIRCRKVFDQILNYLNKKSLY